MAGRGVKKKLSTFRNSGRHREEDGLAGRLALRLFFVSFAVTGSVESSAVSRVGIRCIDFY